MLPHMTVKRNQLEGFQQPLPKPPTPASLCLAPSQQLPHHLAHHLLGRGGLHQLLELLIALEELCHLHFGV